MTPDVYIAPMHPTMHLRLKREPHPLTDTPYLTGVENIRDQHFQTYRLQQLWTDGTKREWRSVPVVNYLEPNA